MIDKFNSVSLKDMHPLQIEALMEFIGTALSIAARDKDPLILEEAKEKASDLVLVLGGDVKRVNGVN